jgi:hypothetical protein
MSACQLATLQHLTTTAMHKHGPAINTTWPLRSLVRHMLLTEPSTAHIDTKSTATALTLQCEGQGEGVTRPRGLPPQLP